MFFFFPLSYFCTAILQRFLSIILFLYCYSSTFLSIILFLYCYSLTFSFHYPLYVLLFFNVFFLLSSYCTAILQRFLSSILFLYCYSSTFSFYYPLSVLLFFNVFFPLSSSCTAILQRFLIFIFNNFLLLSSPKTRWSLCQKCLKHIFWFFFIFQCFLMLYIRIY